MDTPRARSRPNREANLFMTSPHPLRGPGTLRRLRSTGALRGLGTVLSAHGSLRKLRSRRPPQAALLVDRPELRWQQAAQVVVEPVPVADRVVEQAHERGHVLDALSQRVLVALQHAG